MSSLNDRIRELEILVATLKAKLENLTLNTEEKRKKPYSKVGNDSSFDNMPKEFDAEEGVYKPYAIFKDDEPDAIPSVFG